MAVEILGLVGLGNGATTAQKIVRALLLLAVLVALAVPWYLSHQTAAVLAQERIEIDRLLVGRDRALERLEALERDVAGIKRRQRAALQKMIRTQEALMRGVRDKLTEEAE